MFCLQYSAHLLEQVLGAVGCNSEYITINVTQMISIAPGMVVQHTQWHSIKNLHFPPTAHLQLLLQVLIPTRFIEGTTIQNLIIFFLSPCKCSQYLWVSLLAGSVHIESTHTTIKFVLFGNLSKIVKNQSNVKKQRFRKSWKNMFGRLNVQKCCVNLCLPRHHQPSSDLLHTDGAPCWHSIL